MIEIAGGILLALAALAVIAVFAVGATFLRRLFHAIGS